MTQLQMLTVTTEIGGRRYLVGRYKAKTRRAALDAARADLVAMIPLQVADDDAPELPLLLQLQGMTPEDLEPIEF